MEEVREIGVLGYWEVRGTGMGRAVSSAGSPGFGEQMVRTGHSWGRKVKSKWQHKRLCAPAQLPGQGNEDSSWLRAPMGIQLQASPLLPVGGVLAPVQLLVMWGGY